MILKKMLAQAEKQITLLKIERNMTEAESYKMMARSLMLDEEKGSAQWKKYRINYIYWAKEYSRWAELFNSLHNLYDKN